MNFDARINQLGSHAAKLYVWAGVTGAIAATAAIVAIVAIIIIFTLPAAAVAASIVAVSGGGVALLALIATISLLYNKYMTFQRIHTLQELNTQADDLHEEAIISANNPPPSLDKPAEKVNETKKIYLPSKRELTVSQLTTNSETIVRIAKVVKNWVDIAIQKQNNAYAGRCNSLFSDSVRILMAIEYCMENPSKTAGKWDSIFICEDIALKEIQAIALTYSSPGKLKIAYMATHPNNIRSPMNREETTRVEGAASTLIKYLASTLPISCQEIYLESVHTAKQFYQKLGFEELDLKQCPFAEPGCLPMSLSAQKIQAMISLKPEH